MSLLSNLATDNSIADEKDVIGGGSRVLESDVYGFTVQHAYVSKSDGGAIALNVLLKNDQGQQLRQQFWMTSALAKGGKNFYEKDGQKNYLPGFIMANSLALLTTGKEISQLETEQKVIPLYNKDAKAEVPTKVEMLMDLVGKEILAAVIKQTVDKTKKNATTGAYEATGETREENEVEKFFRARDRMTTAEIRAQAETAVFVDTWIENWKGKTKNKAKGAGAANTGSAGLPGKAAGAASGTAKPTTSLFA